MNSIFPKNPISEFIFKEIQKSIDSPIEFFQIFKNPKGTRFTQIGYELASYLWTSYPISFPKGYVVKNKTLLMLDDRMTWPYYLSKTKLFLFNAMDAFEFNLYQGDVNLWANK